MEGLFFSERNFMAHFLDKGIYKFIPIERSPSASGLKEIRQGKEDMALWGWEASPTHRIRTIHEGISPERYMYVQRDESFLVDIFYSITLRILAETGSVPTINLMIVNEPTAVRVLEEMGSLLSNNITVPNLLALFMEKKSHIYTTPYANNGEIILIDSNSYIFKLGYDSEHSLCWNLDFENKEMNYKIILQEKSDG